MYAMVAWSVTFSVSVSVTCYGSSNSIHAHAYTAAEATIAQCGSRRHAWRISYIAERVTKRVGVTTLSFRMLPT